jgi:hypothetical protein
MNRPYLILFAAVMALCLAPSIWARAQERGQVVEFGKLKSAVPIEWVPHKPDDSSTYKQFRLAPVGDDKNISRVTVEFLGKEKDASATQQVKRWKALFFAPVGKRLDDVAKVRELKVPGATVTYLDVRGDYKGIPGNPLSPRQNYRLLGVYFVTPQGPYAIRLLGPAESVDFYRNGFEDWVKGFK